MLKTISTDRAPAAIGTYSQAVVCGDLVFVSGQIGFDPTSGEFVSDDFTEQAIQVFHNLRAILEEAGSGLKQIIKLNVSILDMSQFHLFNSVMEQFFEMPYPARAVVAVRELPKQALVEVEAIGSISSSA